MYLLEKGKNILFCSDVTFTYPEFISVKLILELSIGFDKHVFIL